MAALEGLMEMTRNNDGWVIDKAVVREVSKSVWCGMSVRSRWDERWSVWGGGREGGGGGYAGYTAFV